MAHGDLYAHNILIGVGGHVLLGDFGAAFATGDLGEQMERVEVRAFGCLVDDLLQLSPNRNDRKWHMLRELADVCLGEIPPLRPTFAAIFDQLSTM